MKGLGRLTAIRSPTVNKVTHLRHGTLLGFTRIVRPFSKEKDHFKLEKNFVDSYKNITPPFGFNGLGELVYKRSYSRVKPNGMNENWYETVERVVNGTFLMQKKWLEANHLPCDTDAMQSTAQEMYRRIFEMKFLPPGRGLWAMGTAITQEKGLNAALNNCAFVSTSDMINNPSQPFAFLMDMAIVGVGFDTKGAGTITIKKPQTDGQLKKHRIADSREGWVDSVRALLNVYFLGGEALEMDYSEVRPAGQPIKGFGGVSSGPEPLRLLHEEIRNVLSPLVGQSLTVTAIVDIMNLIGRCVVSGNVRRTAEIALGDANSEEYINLKNYDLNPHRAAYGWTSNNSVLAPLGMNYERISQRIQANGEPGIAWLENMQSYSRMNGIKDMKDYRVMGGNPCLEQSLESYELCCLVETFPHKHKSLEDFKQTLKYAYLYAKTVTLGKTHWAETNEVLLRNRRIGCSMSGLAQFVSEHGLHTLREWCEEGYATVQDSDRIFSEKFAVPRSIKTTCIKPSGTVSLLAGATPGMHYPIASHYLRRVRLPSDSPLLPPLREAGYAIVPAAESPEKTVVVEFPISAGTHLRKAAQLSLWEQLSLAAFLQRHWADNQVSCTVTFDPEKEGEHLKPALEYFQYHLKGIALLPTTPGMYPQMPYEEIDEGTYHRLAKELKPIKWVNEPALPSSTSSVPDKFCDASSCTFEA